MPCASCGQSTKQTAMKLVSISLVSWLSGLLLILSKFFLVNGETLVLLNVKAAPSRR